MPKPLLLTLAFAFGCAVGFGASHVAPRAKSAAAPLAVAPSPDQVGARAREILTGSDPVRRIAELSALLPTLGPDAVPALVEAFDASPLDGGDPELVLLGMWWARFDPAAANRWTSTDWRAQFGSVIAAVFRGWAHSDPREALQLAGAVRFPVQRQLALDAALAGWDESGRPGLIEAVRGLSGNDQQRFAEVLARRRVVSLGAEGAIRWVDALEGPKFREMMALRVAGAAAAVKDGAPLVAAWAEPRIAAAADNSGYPRRIGTRWIKHDPAGAMAWLATLPAGNDRTDGVTETYRGWLIRDRAAAIAWAEKAEIQPWNEPAVAVYARAMVYERPKEALDLVARFSNQGLRETTTVAVARAWLENDREAATAWLEQSGLPEDVRRHAMNVGKRPSPTRIKARAKANADALDQAREEAESQPEAPPN